MGLSCIQQQIWKRLTMRLSLALENSHMCLPARQTVTAGTMTQSLLESERSGVTTMELVFLDLHTTADPAS